MPTLIAGTGGPMSAGLMFRAGRADETLPRSGVTHLLEHLVLHPLGAADYHYNGATGPVTTVFHMQGSEKDVAGFLTGVCETLHDLPLHRLETEKQILRTEQSSRGSHAGRQLWMWRYGSRGFGLPSYPEWGLNMITAEDLRQWAAHYFTRDNAVLWIAGDDVPAGLKLNLPAGERRPVPAVTSALPVTPAYFSDGSNVVMLDAVVRRGPAAQVFAGVLDRALLRELRHESGLSYTAAADYDVRGDGFAMITAAADALPEKQDAMLGAFVDVLARLRAGRIAPADVDAVVGKCVELLTGTEQAADRLRRHAFGLLTEGTAGTAEEQLAECRSVTAEQVHAAAREALDSALLLVPDGRTADWAGFAAAPVTSTGSPRGAGYRSLENQPTRLIVGPEGAGLTHPELQVTVRYDQCSAVLSWPDGRRMLVGHDGVTVGIEPTMFERGAQAVRAVDAAVPAHLRILLPPRAPASIPRPDPALTRPRQPVGAREIRTVLILVVALLLAGFTSGSVLRELLTAPAEHPPIDWLLVAAGFGAAGYFAYAIGQNLRQMWRKPA